MEGLGSSGNCGGWAGGGRGWRASGLSATLVSPQPLPPKKHGELWKPRSFVYLRSSEALGAAGVFSLIGARHVPIQADRWSCFGLLCLLRLVVVLLVDSVPASSSLGNTSRCFVAHMGFNKLRSMALTASKHLKPPFLARHPRAGPTTCHTRCGRGGGGFAGCSLKNQRMYQSYPQHAEFEPL